MVRQIWNYLNLYRWDVALISFIAYLSGSLIAGVTDLKNFFIALAVSILSINFIYSFNSWTDREIDKINKPHRPLPAGKITPPSAFLYSMVLLVFSIIYPFFVYKSYFTLFLFLLLPVLGLLYSGRPVRLKSYFIIAVITTGIILVIPVLLGYFMNESNLSAVPFFIVLFLYCLSVIPIKDIEDVEGDIKYNCENWLYKLGKRKLLTFSLLTLFINILFTLIFMIELFLKLFSLVLIISTVFVIIAFIIFPFDLKLLYRTIIRVVIIESMILFFILLKGGI